MDVVALVTIAVIVEVVAIVAVLDIRYLPRRTAHMHRPAS